MFVDVIIVVVDVIFVVFNVVVIVTVVANILRAVRIIATFCHGSTRVGLLCSYECAF